MRESTFCWEQLTKELRKYVPAELVTKVAFREVACPLYDKGDSYETWMGKATRELKYLRQRYTVHEPWRYTSQGIWITWPSLEHAIYLARKWGEEKTMRLLQWCEE